LDHVTPLPKTGIGLLLDAQRLTLRNSAANSAFPLLF